MSQELARQEAASLPISASAWQTLAQITNTICNTEFVPSGLRGSKPAVMACLLYGHEIGIGPMVSLQNIYIIDGRPSMDASLVAARIRERGHSLQRREHRDEQGKLTGVTAIGRRYDSGDEDTFTFTLEMAKRAGLMSKKNWEKYPEAMLWSRAVTALARALFSDCFVGKVLTPEELGADEPPQGAIEEQGDIEIVGVEESDAGEGAGADSEGDTAPTPTPEPEYDLGNYDQLSVDEVLNRLPELTDPAMLAYVAKYEEGGKVHGDDGDRIVTAIRERLERETEATAQPEPEPEPEGEPEPHDPPIPIPDPLPEPVEAEGPTERDVLVGAIAAINERWPDQDAWHEGVILADVGARWRGAKDKAPESLDELTEDEVARVLSKVPAGIREQVSADFVGA